MNTKKLSRTPDLDTAKCVEMSGGNRFDMIIMASIRAREIARANKNNGVFKHKNAVMDALFDVQSGKVSKDYLKRVK